MKPNTITTPPYSYHLEIWNLDGQGRVQYLRAGVTLQEAKERMRALVMALNWKYYRCGVYLLQNGLNDWQELWEIGPGVRRKIA